MDTNEEKDNNELLNILVEIDEKIDLASKGLLAYTELQETQHKAQDALIRNINHDSQLWREFDRENTTTYWQAYPKSKYTSETGRLPLWRGFVVKALEMQGVQENKKQILIEKGQQYTARQILRDILKSAKSKIDIQDNFVNLEILPILEEYIIGEQKIFIRILTQNVNNSYKSDLLAFIKQYGEVIETRVNTECHDRFLIIDGSEVHHFGHSLKDLGSKVSLINKVDDKETKDKVVNDFEKWWQSGKDIYQQS